MSALGRVAADADTLAPTLVGAGHLLFAAGKAPHPRLKPPPGS